MDYLDQLNPAQRAAVEHTEGPCMVIAGAGSGKTRVLTYRIAHLINKGVDPFNILSLTFTNKAAREMKERISKVIGGTEARNIWMGTFHSIFARILRVEAEKLNYPSNFSIYDSADSKSLLKSIVKEMALDDKLYKVGFVQSRISKAKNNLISPKAYRENAEIMGDDEMSGRTKIVEIYYEYNLRLFKSGAMDFDDLLYKTNVLLRDFPEVLHKYQHKFKYLLVDEYQDTNFSQYLIVKKLAALNENLCVVGDDAQSIYGFRGANIQNILNFKNDYPDYKLFKLEQNYRSTKTIVAAANSVIGKNRDQIKKKVWTDNVDGDIIRVSRSLSDNEEGLFVANDIFTDRNNNQLSNKSFAILYRTNSQSRAMEEALRKINIPYRIYGGQSFYQRKEIKDLLAYYRLTANPKDEESLKRVINYPARGIGKTTLEKITIAAAENQSSLWEVISYGLNTLQVNSGTKQKLADFVTMIRSFGAQLQSLDAFSMAEHIAKSTGLLRELYADKTPEGLTRFENIQELLNGIKEFSESNLPEFNGEKPHLTDFLVDVALLTDADQNDDDDDKVSLMTIHASKGLEFPHVYIVGMEENLFPSQLSLSDRSELEEERRLFYVALTRAEKKTTLTYALSRYRYGTLNHSEPSRFIEEIDPQFIEAPEKLETPFERDSGFGATPWKGMGSSGDSRNFQRKEKYERPASPAPTVPPNLKRVSQVPNISTANATAAGTIVAGSQVVHAKFGKGKVLNVEGESPNEKATVFFPSVGQKQLLLKFAKLTPVA
ncbi:UvrD-helicase domain-containing protein [Cryomorpha ignava]|uniref:DNA 3'-5' helicase n=1 Tax=Cryomorpha ignava TaxID=101383 RepID=A0A7K3WSR6_9FLAO|nr:UvrD-helicase domain-containing protein [Cryomorpha ignava]NEN24524.1 UvrD-helicase domain-containing protein [Cryomorpha ignava]